jgi:hypothetical protein
VYFCVQILSPLKTERARVYEEGEERKKCSGFEVPRQCPLVLLIEVGLRKGKAL